MLEFERVGTRTVVSRALAHSPLRLLQPNNHGHAAWVYTSSLGGGLVGGDDIDLRVKVHPGATGLLATQASTKVYRAARPCAQRLHAEVGDGALLVLYPDPVVCFAGATLRQEQTVDLLSDRASLLLVDSLTAGRCAAGEEWAFTCYRGSVLVRRSGRPLLHESLRLEPARTGLGAHMGRFRAILFAVLAGPALQAEALHRALSSEPVPRHPDVLLTSGVLPGHGVALRVAAVSAERAAAALRERLAFLPRLLGDDPWLRKW